MLNKNRPLTIIISTREIDEKYIQHVEKMFSHPKNQIIVYENKGESSLTEIYNRGFSESTNDIVVFMHDDLILETSNITPKIIKLFDNNPEYGIIGLAGTTALVNATWWNIRESMHGVVGHLNGGKRHVNKYSKTYGDDLKEVVAIDGLFMAINKNKIKHKFNEEFKDFHFYDIPICLDNVIEGVKVGVTTKIMVTHKSIGETNKKWEKNRLLFEALYEKQLPYVIEEQCDLTTFVVCHDARIVEHIILNKKYDSLGNVKIMFVGNDDYSLIEKYDNVIITKNLKHNIEQYPNFTAFTAWYAIWKNNLCQTKYINLLEYDTNLDKLFALNLKLVINKNEPKVISYFPVNTENYHYIQNPDWVTSIFKGISEYYKISIPIIVDRVTAFFKENNREPLWPSTNNVCFEYKYFNDYMEWINPLIDYMKDDIYAGHNQERALSFYSFITNTPVYYFQGKIEHVQADSHKTQGHQVTKQILA